MVVLSFYFEIMTSFPVSNIVSESNTGIIILACKNIIKVVKDNKIIWTSSDNDHSGIIRDISVTQTDEENLNFVSVGDDKLLIWWQLNTSTLQCTTLGQELFRKKLISVCMAAKDVAVVGDKFGDGHVSRKVKLEAVRGEFNAEFGLLSTLTAMTQLPNGSIAVAERECKLLVLSNPLFCEYRAILLGHEEFVSALGVLVRADDDVLLVSASGDTTLRLWQPETGVQVGEPLRVGGDDSADAPVWRALACRGADSLVAVAQDGRAFVGVVDANTNAFTCRQIDGISTAVAVCAAKDNGYWLSDHEGVHWLPNDCNVQTKVTLQDEAPLTGTQAEVAAYVAAIDVSQYVHLSYRKEKAKKKKLEAQQQEKNQQQQEEEKKTA